MPVYEFRLEDKSGEFRRGKLAEPSQDEAVHLLELRELSKVIYQLPAFEVAALEKKLKSGELSSVERSRLLTHRQEQPYKLKKMEKS